MPKDQVKLLHITPESNIDSIMHQGIKRANPSLSHHSRAFHKLIKHWDGKASYFLPPSERWLKDFIYWKTWGEPINKFLDNNVYEEDLEKLDLFVKQVELNINKYLILECLIKNRWLMNTGNHAQDHEMSYPLFNHIDPRYEHNDKPLLITYHKKVKPENIKIVGSGEPLIDKRNRINVLLNW